MVVDNHCNMRINVIIETFSFPNKFIKSIGVYHPCVNSYISGYFFLWGVQAHIYNHALLVSSWRNVTLLIADVGETTHQCMSNSFLTA